MISLRQIQLKTFCLNWIWGREKLLCWVQLKDKILSCLLSLPLKGREMLLHFLFPSPVSGCTLSVSPSSWLWFSFVLSRNWVNSLKHWKNYPVNGRKKKKREKKKYFSATLLSRIHSAEGVRDSSLFDRKTAQLGQNQRQGQRMSKVRRRTVTVQA